MFAGLFCITPPHPSFQVCIAFLTIATTLRVSCIEKNPLKSLFSAILSVRLQLDQDYRMHYLYVKILNITLVAITAGGPQMNMGIFRHIFDQKYNARTAKYLFLKTGACLKQNKLRSSDVRTISASTLFKSLTVILPRGKAGHTRSVNRALFSLSICVMVLYLSTGLHNTIKGIFIINVLSVVTNGSEGIRWHCSSLLKRR